jgi:hypothetical protein
MRAQPRGNLATVLETASTRDRCDQCARSQRADAGDLFELAAEFAAAVPGDNLLLELLDLPIQLLQMLSQAIDQVPKRHEEFIAGILEDLGHSLGHVVDALGNDKSKFSEQPADLIGLRGTTFTNPWRTLYTDKIACCSMFLIGT